MSSGLKLDRADTAYAERAHELSVEEQKLVAARQYDVCREDR
jgi:hypothetical protein